MKVSIHLEHYVRGIDLFAKMFAEAKGKEFRPIDLTKQGDLKNLLGRIENELEPENLHCDGELPLAKVRSKYRKLIKIQKEVECLLMKEPA